MFFSTHKIGSLFSSGLVFMSNYFYNEILDAADNEEQIYPELTNDFLRFNCGTFNIPGFTSAFLTAMEYHNIRVED